MYPISAKTILNVGKENIVAMKILVLLSDYELPVSFSQSSLADALDVSAPSVSTAIKYLKENNSDILTFYKVGTGYLCVPASIKTEYEDNIAVIPTYTILTKQEQNTVETDDGEYEEKVDE